MRDSVPLAVQRGYGRTALTPKGWSVVGGRERGDALELARIDGRVYAAFLIVGVSTVMRRTCDTLFGTPENAIKTTLSQYAKNPTPIQRAHIGAV